MKEKKKAVYKMSKPFDIRQAMPGDLERIIEIEAEGFPAAEAASAETLKERFAVFGECFLVAEDKDGIMGYVGGAVLDKPILEDECYHDCSMHNPQGTYQSIFSLVTSKRVRRQGVGRALITAFVEKAKKEGRKGSILTCKDHLIPFYKSVGYKHQGVSASEHGGAAWNDMLYLFE